ncbi:hypothetical protein GCM10029964_119450 [Kibdelosporangium lantanae]
MTAVVAALFAILGSAPDMIPFYAFWVPLPLTPLVFARDRRSFRLACVVVGTVALVGLTVADIGKARPYDAFVVRFDEAGYEANEGTLAPSRLTPPPFGRGATSVSFGGTRWTVFHQKDLSEQDKAALREYPRGLPAVVDVRPCDPSPWGCR